MKTHVEIMHEAGFITAAEAAELLGFKHVGTIHRMVKKKSVHGERVGHHWYVLASSLLGSTKESPTMHTRVESFMKANKIPIVMKEKPRGKSKRGARK